ncbi:MAG: hypothetical protein FWF31_04595 [Desulfobulbus sp.]|nr:hypothetical protein [Desulfobulbus sp.]
MKIDKRFVEELETYGGIVAAISRQMWRKAVIEGARGNRGTTAPTSKP